MTLYLPCYSLLALQLDAIHFLSFETAIACNSAPCPYNFLSSHHKLFWIKSSSFGAKVNSIDVNCCDMYDSCAAPSIILSAETVPSLSKIALLDNPKAGTAAPSGTFSDSRPVLSNETPVSVLKFEWKFRGARNTRITFSSAPETNDASDIQLRHLIP